MKFRQRDGVCISYEVRGIPNSTDYPYINDLATLKEAVAIGRSYPGIYGDGAATHIVRRYSKRLPEGHEFHHSSKMTHRWRVDQEGRLQLVTAYREETCRPGPLEYAENLPPMPNRATTLQGELLDLATVAEKIGLLNASKALTDHVYGRNQLPVFRPFKVSGRALIESGSCIQGDNDPGKVHPKLSRPSSSSIARMLAIVTLGAVASAFGILINMHPNTVLVATIPLTLLLIVKANPTWERAIVDAVEAAPFAISTFLLSSAFLLMIALWWRNWSPGTYDLLTWWTLALPPIAWLGSAIYLAAGFHGFSHGNRSAKHVGGYK